MPDSLKISPDGNPVKSNKGVTRSVPSNRSYNKKKHSKEILYFVTKQKVIEAGLEYLDGMGTNMICKVCIPSGGSCCLNCHFLINGVGCQQRNTSCTAWLCGFLKFIFYEAGLIKEWEKFWDQVPGQDFRKDFTPSSFTVYKWLDSPNIRFLSEAFAEDLQELKKNNHPYWLIEIKDTLDRHVDKILDYNDPEITRNIEKKIKYLTKDFRRFHLAKEQLV